MSGETCPEGTIPVRRTKEQDILRASLIRRFGRKIRRPVRRDTTSNGHEHAVGYVTGDQYYGAKRYKMCVHLKVTNQYEFSLSQMWVISGSFGDDLNTIEAGWQACASRAIWGQLSKSDAYQATGCYNLLCSVTIQTNKTALRGSNFSNILLAMVANILGIKDLEGSKAWTLVAGIWIRSIGRILAIIFVHTPKGFSKYDTIWR
ncbi:hypothetical protein HAX54_053536 [Datura stramonium]|uniref:Neprosin PEP catalytic domain-containing protein n=1 Tax=Datura stramonium TaxID=4076 RepID=A0ABS8T181_DATST|nr:hypothetical protein [Datura stramonium]